MFETGTENSFELQIFSFLWLKLQKKCLHFTPRSRLPSYNYYFRIAQALARTRAEVALPITLHKRCVGPQRRASQGSNVDWLNTKDSEPKQTTFAPYSEAHSIPGDKRKTQVCLW